MFIYFLVTEVPLAYRRSLLGAYAKKLLHSALRSIMSVRLSSGNSATPTGWIFHENRCWVL